MKHNSDGTHNLEPGENAPCTADFPEHPGVAFDLIAETLNDGHTVFVYQEYVGGGKYGGTQVLVDPATV